ncbi:YfiR family protein [Sorangium sp. So ce1153]|uniref:YfiR family protein n=1 Tax=Sorangium sp. So ce1153 TaxID=3133333 RepID=UPI003F60979E
MTLLRRSFLLGVAAAAASAPRRARAEPASAPFPVQAEIVTRILPYDRGFPERARGQVAFLLLAKAGDADSASAAQQMKKALTDIGKVRDKPIRAESAEYTTAPELAAACRAREINVLYVSSGLAKEVGAIRGALADSGVLTVAAVEPYVPLGVVLGIDVANGKPRMSINLAQARSQRIDFPSSILKLARIY